MNKLGIAYNTCDRPELTRRSIEPLLQRNKFSLHWIDGSKTEEGKRLPDRYDFHTMHRDVRGGSGPAIVYSLTKLLAQEYDFVGLCENDVCLDQDWFEPTMALFERGKQAGLEVGAVSARSYEDRLLFQKDGFGVFHNLGAGFIIFTRKAAEIVLQTYRTVWTTENRLLFAQLSGLDIGAWWAFKGSQNFLVADWRFDMVLAAHGLASLALTPSKAKMLDQDIEPLGLKYADGNVPEWFSGKTFEHFERYRDNLQAIREGKLIPGANLERYHDGNAYTIFPHQIPKMGGVYNGDWRIRDFLGYGPFAWKAGPGERAYGDHSIYPGTPELIVPVSGPCDIVVSGGELGGKFRIEDEQSGYDVDPFVPAEGAGNFLQISVPGSAGYRKLRLTALNPGVCFMGLKCREPQITLPGVRFDHSVLPPV